MGLLVAKRFLGDKQTRGHWGVPTRILNRVNAALSRQLPEQRLFLRSDTETRFIRLRPMTQFAVLLGSGAVISWTIVASAILLMDTIGSGTARDQAQRKQAVYEKRLDTIARERDARATELVAAQERFQVALDQVSTMQSALLASEERRRELETGINVIQSTLKRTMAERDDARESAATAVAELKGDKPASEGASADDLVATLDVLTGTLGQTAAERDLAAASAAETQAQVDQLIYARRVDREREEQIFDALEDAITVSMDPLEKVFRSAGINPDSLLKEVRKGYSGIGGPLTPVSVSTKNDPEAAIRESRAQELLEGFDRLNSYRIAAESVPLAFPLNTAFRYSSPYGRRWGRMHEGIDFAGAYGSPILVTADGVVTKAGWMNGYGNLVEVRHSNGIFTRYGHMSKIRVKVGQKVSRGDRLGDMGSTGRSTGTHLHYEVRPGGSPVDPMTFIKAGKNVF